MEYLKVIKHTNGDDKCLENVVNYPIGRDQFLKEGFGINPDDSYQAFKQFKKVAEFWGNENCTPCFHYVTAFTGETAPTAEKAMELTTAIFKDITDSHLAATGTHFKDREWNQYHNHTVVSPTNINNGSLMYGNNTTNFALAQKMANVTGQPTKLIIRKEDGTEVEVPQVFVPHDYED